MASGKRASMREGPLAQLFRKTEEDDARPKAEPPQEEPPRPAARCPRVGPLPRSLVTCPSRRGAPSGTGAPSA